MSQEVGNIFVSLGLNMDNFNAGISNINRQMKLVQSEFKASAAKLSDFGSASDLVKLKTDSLSQQITLQKQKIDLLQSSIDNAVQKSSKHGQALHDIRTKLEAVRSEYNDVSSSMGKNSEQAQKLADTIAKLEAQEKAKIQTLQSDDKAIDNNRIKLNQYTEQLAKMETQLRTASEGLDGSSGKMKDLGESSSSLGSRLASLGAIVKSSLVFSAVYEGIGALTGGIKGLISTSMDFEATMSKVQALSGATGQQLQELRNQAIQLGSSTVFSASDAANGMADLAAAGFTAQQTMAAMPGILNAAAAAGEDFDSVSQIMISTMSAFGMKASDMGHIADVMAAAANASTISIGDMGQTLQYAAPLAKSAGVSLEALSADIAIMGNAGIKGSDAGTALREALTRLAAPPAAAAKALQSLGIATKDSQGKMVPFNTILEEMHDKFQHLGQAQQLQAASAIFGQNAMSGMMTIVAASPAKIDALTRAFENSNGAAAKMASQMNNNLKGAVQQMEGAFESASIKIGGLLSPVLTKMANGIASVVGVISASNPGQAFVNLFPKSMQIGVEYFFDQMKGSIQDIKDAFGSTLGAKVSAFFASFKGAGTVAAKALEDVGGAIHAIVGLITGHEGQFTGFMQAMNIPPSISQAFENVMSLIKEAYSNVAPQFKAAFAQIVTFFKTNWPEISLAIRNVMSVILSIFNAVWPLIKS
ncbi:phage tail tape measure protein [Alicyclobacillus fastidiosus]|uniref:Phage tail tape measure protein n=1 Tax=Alicyclobacillus fastidiosus TaxID=392011 RepID=A0ABY6ZLL5_9BACL|nr:phage tail tape measure protein [Alicyclobacillus fastidiosus]WAH42830.1 phage tail tape measure protein [Alicyclobacillus fastidiosus]GMA64761.1 hypothetical protein GCM10025859_52010 [Alicyclobacillus fastidiosus]